MRGSPKKQLALAIVDLEALIPSGHPIRRIRAVVEEVLVELDSTFAKMYAEDGRPSVPPEALLKASVLMALYSIRSERAFCERLNYDMLFKWFLDMGIDQAAFDASTFAKNRQRLISHDVAGVFFAAVLRQAKLRRYVSSDHFSVDGTVLEAWASHKSFKPKDDPGAPRQGRNPDANFHREKRSNQTHESTTDPESRLYRKSSAAPAKMAYLGHTLMENRSGIIVDVEFTQADGRAERAAASAMMRRQPKRSRRRTIGADKGYDTADFVVDAREAGFTPHVAQHTNARSSAIDGRTAATEGYATSQRIRKRVEESFGWLKTVGGGRKLRYRGRQRNAAWFNVAMATYNVIRIVNLDTART